MTDPTALMTALARCAAALGHPAEVTYVARKGYLYAALGERWESSPGVPCAKSESPVERGHAERCALARLATLIERETGYAVSGVRSTHYDLARARSQRETTARRLADAERAYREAQAAHETATQELHAAEAAYDAAASEHPKAALAQTARDELSRAMRGER